MQTDIYLIDYLEGELEKENEAELFKALSESEELRAKMTILLRTKEVSAKYLDNVTVPASVTDKLFAGLGMPDAFSESAAKSEPIPKKKKNRKFYFIIPALFAASLIGFIGGYFISGRNSNELKPKEIINKNISLQNVLKDSNSDTLNNSSQFAQNNIQHNTRKIPKVNQYISDKYGKNLTEINKEVNEIAALDNRSETVKPIIFSKSEFTSDKFNFSLNTNNRLLSEKPIIFPLENEFQPYENYSASKISIETGRANYLKLNDKSRQNINLPLMNNTSLSIAYYLSENIAVGMEYKIESFSGTVFDNNNYVSVNKKTKGCLAKCRERPRWRRRTGRAGHGNFGPAWCSPGYCPSGKNRSRRSCRLGRPG